MVTIVKAIKSTTKVTRSILCRLLCAMTWEKREKFTIWTNVVALDCGMQCV